MLSGAAHRRGRRAVGAAAALLGCAGLGGSALASAWNRTAGEGLAIIDGTFGGGDAVFDARGRLAQGRAYSKGEAAAYVEYGATDWLTLIARPSLDSVRVGAPGASTYRGLGDTDVGAQWQALAFGPAVLAVQGSFMLPGLRRTSTEAASVGDTARAGEARLLGGVALPVPFRPFLDLQTSYRVRSSGAAPEWHADATFGLYPTDRLLVLAQSFTAVPLGRGTVANPASRSTRLGLSGVYAVTQTWALQLGLFTTAWGRDTSRMRGFTVGVWRYF